MTRRTPDPTVDERLERLLDEELRAAMQSQEVDLRSRVLHALEERVGPGLQAAPGFAWTARPRWAALALVAAALLVAVVFVWRGFAGREPERLADHRPTLQSTPVLAGQMAQPLAQSPLVDFGTSTTKVVRRLAGAWEAEPALAVASTAAAEPYFPGAPLGELGDPLRPMPTPPPITFAPIASAPPVFEFARPVTEFADDNPAPAVPSGTAGHSGGTRR